LSQTLFIEPKQAHKHHKGALSLPQSRAVAHPHQNAAPSTQKRYHGKSTLLEALQTGVYNKVPGDGRELVVALPDAVKVRVLRVCGCCGLLGRGEGWRRRALWV
jgi:hypothetical protein